MPLFDWIRSDLHSLNLDWIISKIKTVEESEQGAVDAAANANASKSAAAASATAANNSKNAAAGSATLAAVSAQQAQNLVDQLDTTIAQDVSDWLDEHITPTTPAVDDTLTVSGAAADAAVTGDKITDLKTAIQTLENYVGEEKPEHLTLVSGGMNNATGAIYADNTRAVSKDLIYLETGDVFSVDSSVQYVCCRYDSTGTFQEAITPNGYTGTALTVATTGFYKFGLRLKNEQSADISSRLSEVEAKTYLTYVQPKTGMVEDVSDLQEDVSTLIENVDNAVKRVISDDVTTITKGRSELSTGIVYPDGSTVSSSAIYHFNFAVETGDVVSVRRFYYNSAGVPTSIFAQKIAAVCAYNGSTAVSAKGLSYNANADSYTVPEGIDNITISFTFSGAYDSAYIDTILPNSRTDFFPVDTVFKNPNKYSGVLSANTFQKIGDFVSVDDYVLTCNAKIDSNFSSLKIGGFNAGGINITNPYVEVTPTQVKMYSNTDSSYNKTADHGLTLANDLQVIVIASKDSLHARFIIQSNGQRWENTENWRFGSVYYGFGAISATNISRFDASVSVRDLYKPVWVCGDSWVTFFDARWYGQAIALGIKNFLHSGHSGEGSKDGLAHLKTLLSMYTPKMIVWLYGMNDADTNDSTPNADWLTAVNELETICENMTIDLVLATIPTTPTRNNNAKNAVVTASGYRYVDEVSAMGADTAGNWIAGYQSTDGNHTTEAGARALLAQVLSDVPEIAIN